jgi:FMN-dependent NADH-azoreductase
MNVLHLDSSILGEASASRKLTREVVEQLRANDPDLAVVYRDLAAHPIPHLTGEVLATRGTAAGFLNEFQAREARLDADLHAELRAADVLVIGAPLYNFSVPTGLKAWIDRILVAGKTFRYTDKGPEGLVKGKRAIVVATSGGLHADSPVDGAHVGYLKGLLAFLGITDVEVVRAEGLAVSDQVRVHAMAKARGQIRALGVLQAA